MIKDRRYRLLLPLWAGALFLFLLMAGRSRLCTELFLSGILVLGRKVLPSVFPYLVLGGILSKTGALSFFGGKRAERLTRLFFLPGSCLPALLAGLFSGFPLGAAVTSEIYLQGRCTKGQAERLSALCNFCGPPFLLGAFGQGVLGDVRLGFLFFLVQTVIVLLYGILQGLWAKKRGEDQTILPPKGAFAEKKQLSPLLQVGRCIAEGALQTVRIGGYVLFFLMVSGVLCRTLFSFFAGHPLFEALLCGFFEFSSGVSAIGSGGATGLLFGGMIVCFSGLSVHMQVAGFLNDAGLSAKKHLRCHLFLCPVVPAASLLLARVMGLL